MRFLLPNLGFISMKPILQSALKPFALLITVGLFWILSATAMAQEKSSTKPTDTKLTEPITKGLRVFTCGHSFHVWVPGIITDLCKKSGITDHVQVGLSSIGGSRVIQHWDIAPDKNKAKDELKTGKVDVLTLSPIFLPDAGIENFTKLALEHNKNIRIIVQPIWLRWDIYEPTTKRPEKVDHNAITGDELREDTPNTSKKWMLISRNLIKNMEMCYILRRHLRQLSHCVKKLLQVKPPV